MSEVRNIDDFDEEREKLEACCAVHAALVAHIEYAKVAPESTERLNKVEGHMMTLLDKIMNPAQEVPATEEA